MKTIHKIFEDYYKPVKAIVLFENNTDGDAVYLEAYDMDANGYPINARPLGIDDARALVKTLQVDPALQMRFTQPKGMLPKNILYHSNAGGGFVVWHTPAKRLPLLFADALGIPSGEAAVPPLVWKATQTNLFLFAHQSDDELTHDTTLYKAPFFNLYENSSVCMGTVNVEITPTMHVEQFMAAWETAFFRSYFTHTNATNLTKGSIVSLWKKLIGTGKPFPMDKLVKTKRILKNLFS